MKKRHLLIASLAASVAMQALAQHASDIRISVPQPGTWSYQTSITQTNGIEVLHVTLDSPTPQTPPQFTLSLTFPQLDIHHVWSTDYGKHCQLQPDWVSPYTSQLASNLPLYTLLNDNNENRLTIASDEAMRYVEARIGLHEEDCSIVCDWTFFKQPEAPMKHYEVSLMLDNRQQFWSQSVEQGMDWMRQSSGLQACQVPAGAEEPLYSTWYQFHQDVHASDIEAECRLASTLGMKTIILDDGWQTDDTNRGYAYCGDWQVSPRRFADMKVHVSHVHDMGIKYMMWYSVPFIGIKSRNYERFKGKFLFFDQGAQAGVLDPRFPEVRDFLCNLYVKAMQDWGLDGFKLDFIDTFRFNGADPAVAQEYAGRDIKALPEAINRLMKEIHDRLSSLNPEVLIEFRQSYIGPAICQYGNMMRSGDCPGDLTTNRSHIAYLRLTSGQTAVHADMLEWNREETTEDAARAILSAIFGVIQYSVMLREATPEQTEVIRHWLQFSQEHRATLLHGKFLAYHPERDFPVLEAIGKEESIIGLYQDDAVAKVSADRPVTYVLNGTGASHCYIELGPKVQGIEVYDTFGKLVRKLTGVESGLHRIDIPKSGSLRITSHS